MRILSAAEVDAALDDIALIDRLEAMFRPAARRRCAIHHALPDGHAAADAGLDAPPCRHQAGHGLSRQRQRSLPSVFGQYVLLDGRPASRWRCSTAPC
jgi:ornithine cyclodeaminase